jgi:hypothetical protein
MEVAFSREHEGSALALGGLGLNFARAASLSASEVNRRSTAHPKPTESRRTPKASISRDIEPARTSPNHPDQPLGCASPTFAGAGFDAAELAAVIARTAVSGCGSTTYPPLDYNWAALNFTTDPRWTAGVLDPDACCSHHR